MAGGQGEFLEAALEKAISRNQGGPVWRTLKSPFRLLFSKLVEKSCLWTGVTTSLMARTFWGERMRVEFPEIVSCFLYRYGYFEPDLTKIVMRHIKPGDVFIDVGTHFGYYSMLASKLVGANGQVHSFEPTSHTYEVAMSNLSKKSNVKLNNFAVWREKCSLVFKDYGRTMSAFNSLYGAKLEENDLKGLLPTEYDVQATTIDDYTTLLGITPNFIKIDAENAEYDILVGMSATLENCRPIVTLEVGDVNQGPFKNSAASVNLLIDFGYKAYEQKGDTLVEHVASDVYKHTNLVFLPN
ncbi:MAG: FkbM family methyltransferase [Allorhizobium sp.]